MRLLKLSSRARTLLWTGSGAFVGLALGVSLVDSAAAGDFAVAWMVLFGLFLGATLWWGREKKGASASSSASAFPSRRAARADASPASASASAASSKPIRLEFLFPDVPAGFPPVLGVEEPVRVRVAVHQEGAPAEGAAVRLSGHPRDGARFVVGEGVTGTDGSVEFALKRAQVGELVVEAEASLDEATARGSASVSLVRYDEEIERLFSEFRAYAHEALGPESRADTARELAEKLREGADQPTSKALLELARIYELVAYGERDADRRLYLALVGALLTIERAASPDEPERAAPHAGG